MTLPLFLIPIIAGIIAQSLKPIFGHKLLSKKHKLPRYGGMPSAHTSFAASLATLLGIVDGFASASFAIGVAALILILDDALRMRIFLGRHGQAITRLIKKLPPVHQSDFPHLETQLGHKVPEVFAGGALGIVVTIILLWVT